MIYWLYESIQANLDQTLMECLYFDSTKTVNMQINLDQCENDMNAKCKL